MVVAIAIAVRIPGGREGMVSVAVPATSAVGGGGSGSGIVAAASVIGAVPRVVAERTSYTQHQDVVEGLPGYNITHKRERVRIHRREHSGTVAISY